MIPIEVFTKPPIPGQRLTKEQAGYVERGPFGCQDCQWFEKPQTGGSNGACRPVGGPVASDGCCDFDNDPDAPFGLGKAGAEYVHVPGAHYICAECRYFNGVSACWPVIGRISRTASCNKWTP